ncbi:XdhC family protein [Phaeobacter sp.]|uniref:XdhC family protein n=1 Tax=Phaeobacter sp. TaxID=1902409 RepID=UPI0025E24032|nr:XdhC family protein [Phaeobacter sp.]
MTPAELTDLDLASVTTSLRSRGAPFAIATVTRASGFTAAKPGAKAVLLADGSIAHGWVGGGCVRSALAKAARVALQDGQPQLISLKPQEVLDAEGITAGTDHDGVRFARNGCPSKGSLDIFLEPVLPKPALLIYGTSPVAKALHQLAAGFDWAVQVADAEAASEADRTRNGSTHKPAQERGQCMIVVATQGKGDADALRDALQQGAAFTAFVSSRRKFVALRHKLEQDGVDPAALAEVHAPAGLAIDAVTPEEIALSILAQLTQVRRSKQRARADHV